MTPASAMRIWSMGGHPSAERRWPGRPRRRLNRPEVGGASGDDREFCRAGMRDMRSASVAAALEAMPRAQDDARGMAAARLLQSGRGRAQAAGVYRMMTPSRRRVAWRSIAVSMRRARRKRRPWRPCEPHNTDDIASVIVANDIITVWILMSGLSLTGTPDATARTGGIGMQFLHDGCKYWLRPIGKLARLAQQDFRRPRLEAIATVSTSFC